MKRLSIALGLAAGLFLSGCGLGDAAMNAVPVPTAPSETPTPSATASTANDADPYGLTDAVTELAQQYDLGAMNSADLLALLQQSAPNSETVDIQTLCSDLESGRADMDTLREQALTAIEDAENSDPDGVQLDFGNLGVFVEDLWSVLDPALADLNTLCR